MPSIEKPERIARHIARAGHCSRREAERWIEAGRVRVNGEVITSPALNVGPDDVVEVDGAATEKAATRLWLYHKPAGLITTHRDPEGRDTVCDALPKDMPRVISIGRLDLTSEGLLLLTNDGALARHLELPSTGWIRRYRVRIYGDVTPRMIEKLASGLSIDGVKYGSITAVADKKTASNMWVTVSLTEGKNRELRKVFEHLGTPVTRLIRTAYGPFQIGDMKKGEVKEVTQRVLKEQLGAFFPLPRAGEGSST